MAISEDELAEELRSVCRTAIGDELRSLTYFTADDFEHLYLRSDLQRDADPEKFVTNERLGFTSQQTYGDSELGEYEFTIRVFERGYLTRVIAGHHGAYVTTDPLNMNQFHEVATAVGTVLRELDE